MTLFRLHIFNSGFFPLTDVSCSEHRSLTTSTVSNMGVIFFWKTLTETLVNDQIDAHFCASDGHLQSVTIPDAVLIQFDLLMMGTTLLETCRGL